jgi:hypothetical protein
LKFPVPYGRIRQASSFLTGDAKLLRHVLRSLLIGLAAVGVIALWGGVVMASERSGSLITKEFVSFWTVHAGHGRIAEWRTRDADRHMRNVSVQSS